MKNLFYTLLLFTSLGFCQSTEFTFTKDGITDYLVVEVPNKTASELYTQTINWINTYYKNPESVIRAKIENDYIRWIGTSSDFVVLNVFGKAYISSSYQIEVSFQDGKYKFDLIDINILQTKGDPNMTLTNMSEYYKSNGEVKGRYKYYPEAFTSFFNEMNKNLFDYLLGNSKKTKKDW